MSIEGEKSIKIAERLKELRIEAGLKKSNVIEYLGISESTYKYYECDTEFSTNHMRNLGMPVRNLIRLAKLYKCSTDYILGLNDSTKPVKDNE